MPKYSHTSIVERYKELIVVMQELASILNTEHLLEHIIDAAKRLSDADLVWLLFPDHVDQTLVLNTASFTRHRGLQRMFDYTTI